MWWAAIAGAFGFGDARFRDQGRPHRLAQGQRRSLIQPADDAEVLGGSVARDIDRLDRQLLRGFAGSAQSAETL